MNIKLGDYVFLILSMRAIAPCIKQQEKGFPPNHSSCWVCKGQGVIHVIRWFCSDRGAYKVLDLKPYQLMDSYGNPVFLDGVVLSRGTSALPLMDVFLTPEEAYYEIEKRNLTHIQRTMLEGISEFKSEVYRSWFD